MKTRRIQLILIACTVLLLSSCADTQPNIKECLEGHQYGFWGGIWHGMIAPIAFIISLFKDDVAVFAINNNGNWYVFGFLLGVSSSIGSSSVRIKKRK